MHIKIQRIGLYTLVRHEWERMFRIFIQVFLPPLVTTALYFMIFGQIMGHQIGPIQGVSYANYIAPGLMMIMVINNTYANVSTSLFSRRYFKNIEEILVSPMHYGILLLGYVLGGVSRGLIVAALVLLVATFFIPIDVGHLPALLGIITLIAIVFALAGFTNGLIARNFEDVALVPTFILSPLTYLGGVFYTLEMLPSFWQKVSLFNPIMYMVDAVRKTMIPSIHTPLLAEIGLIVSLIVVLFALNMILLKKGVGLRT